MFNWLNEILSSMQSNNSSINVLLILFVLLFVFVRIKIYFYETNDENETKIHMWRCFGLVNGAMHILNHNTTHRTTLNSFNVSVLFYFYLYFSCFCAYFYQLATVHKIRDDFYSVKFSANISCYGFIPNIAWNICTKLNIFCMQKSRWQANDNGKWKLNVIFIWMHQNWWKQNSLALNTVIKWNSNDEITNNKMWNNKIWIISILFSIKICIFYFSISFSLLFSINWIMHFLLYSSIHSLYLYLFCSSTHFHVKQYFTGSWKLSTRNVILLFSFTFFYFVFIWL